MFSYLVALGVLLHTAFWGAGLAMLAMPRPWRRWWPVLTLPAGFALQSLAVWLGAYAGLKGTQSYAWIAESLPVVLLIGARWRRTAAEATRDVVTLWSVWIVMAGVLGAIMWPLAQGAHGLGTVSLGSCDAADYAAGGRALLEFARGDRSGFMGLTEVVRIGSVDNFSDYWLRLNHFTPAALIALNSAVFACPPHELLSLLTAVLLAAAVPTVWWLARTLGAQRRGPALVVAALYGLSALTWYAVAQVAMGQLLAALAIAWITWAGVVLWRGGVDMQCAKCYAGVLVLAYALVLGSYNFIVLVCLAPAALFAGGEALRRGAWSQLARWLAAMLVPLAIAGVVFFSRVAGLAERLSLLQAYDFGWKIPLLTPEAWLGVVQDSALTPFGWRWIAVAVVAAMMVLGIALARGRRWLLLALLVPPVVGYAFLYGRGAMLGTNASYDAYKLLSVFLPSLLVAAGAWLNVRGGLRWILLALVIAGNVSAWRSYYAGFANPPLVVDRELLDVRKVEAMPDVASVNVLLTSHMWPRLWANELLLRKPQYFQTHTYEARRNTPLHGDWDLSDNLVSVRLPGEATRRLNSLLWLADTRNPDFFRAELGDGWHELEKPPRAAMQWRWTKGDATVRVINPQSHAIRARVHVDARSLAPREVQLWSSAKQVGAVQIGTTRAIVDLGEVELPPGESTLVVRSSTPPAPAGGGDARLLGWAAYGIEFETEAGK